jgi:hypothetical protein
MTHSSGAGQGLPKDLARAISSAGPAFLSQVYPPLSGPPVARDDDQPGVSRQHRAVKTISIVAMIGAGLLTRYAVGYRDLSPTNATLVASPP